MIRLFTFSLLALIFLCLTSASSAFAQTITPSLPTGEIENNSSDSNTLNSFIAGFDWISSGLIFYTPSLLNETITLQDGTELKGMSNFRTIFYDIAIPLFVLITSFIAFSHISNDNTVQLRQFFRRLLFIVVLFILTPAILSYSIQFVNLLNEKIIEENAYNLSTLGSDFLAGFMEIPMFQRLFSAPILIPTWNTVLDLIVLVISVGFLLIGFIFIVFQAVIRFIALLVLSVIFPIVLPFALSEKTENIANTFFRTWFSFLIQQPAFVLGFAIVSAMLASILQAHNNSIGTLFVYSGALIFLGGINVFIGRIFSEGWSLVSANAQSFVGARAVNRGTYGFVRNPQIRRIPTQTGKMVGRFAQGASEKMRTLFQKKQNAKRTTYGRNNFQDVGNLRRNKLQTKDGADPQSIQTRSSGKETKKGNVKNEIQNNTAKKREKDTSKQASTGSQPSKHLESSSLSGKKDLLTARRSLDKQKPATKPSSILTRKPVARRSIKKIARKRVNL